MDWFFSHKRIVLYAVGGLILLGAVLFGIDRCSTWNGQRKIDKIKANVNASLANIANLEAQKHELELKQAAELEAAKRNVQDFADAANATVQARTETNKALENLNAVKNSNADVNVSVSDLQKKLEALEK